jgi:hypothetical protein
MRQSQVEIKAIEAELRSIRAEKALPHDQSVTLLDPTLPRSTPEAQSISPKITPSPPASRSAARAAKPDVKRVECFPLPNSQFGQPAPSARPSESVRRFKQVQTQFIKDTSRQQQEMMRHLVSEKAKQINHLSHQQEKMILELMKLSNQLEQNLPISSTRKRRNSEPICEYEAAEVPYVDTDRSGTFILTTRAVESLHPDDASAEVAQSLRHRSRKLRLPLLYQMGLSVWRLTWTVVNGVGAVSIAAVGTVGKMITAPLRWLLAGESTVEESAAPRRKTYRGSGRRAVATEMVTLQSLVLTVAGAAVLRIAMDWLVASHPALWLPSVFIMLLPALIAIYRSTVTPQTGFAWGYRLFAILIGLLLGGRLL